MISGAARAAALSSGAGADGALTRSIGMRIAITPLPLLVLPHIA